MSDYDDFLFQLDYPSAQWHNGAIANKAAGGVPYTGGLLLPAAKLPEGAKITGTWKGPLDWTFETGKTEPVFAASEAFIALLQRRRRWFNKSESGKPTVYYTDAQASGRRDLRSQLQVLCAVKGVPVPIIISVKGERSRAMDKAMSSFFQNVILAANNLDNCKHPLYHYWLKIASSVAAGGDQGFIPVGTDGHRKSVALPVAVLPEVVDEAYLQKAAVPEPLRAQCAQWRELALPWSKAWAINPSADADGDLVVDPDTGEIL